jgi:hypothetical protein
MPRGFLNIYPDRIVSPRPKIVIRIGESVLNNRAEEGIDMANAQKMLIFG